MSYDRIKCPICNVDFGQEKRFVAHCNDVHGIVADEAYYVQIVCNGTAPTCACGCGKTTMWNGWKKGYTSQYLRGHNAAVDNVFSDPERMKRMVEKRVDGYRSGRISVWNAGLTKETDERVARQSVAVSNTLSQAYRSGDLVDWRKTDPEKAIEQAKKSSNTKKRKFASGESKIWNEGLTKETSSSIASAAEKISAAFRNRPDMGARIKLSKVKQRIDKFSDKFTLVSNINEYKHHDITRFVFRCNTCGEETLKSLNMLESTPICFHCHPKESKGQLEVLDYIRSLGINDVVSNDRAAISPKELDIYVPSKKFAVEYNGLYWHSEQFLGKHYHDEKLSAAENAGLSLLMIYEDEWRDRRHVIEGMIKHRLNLDIVRVHARKCVVKEVPVEQRIAFFDSAHLEGDVRSVVAFGLYFEDRLVACMSLRRPFHKKYEDYLEVGRSACLPTYAISGWIGKLTKACKEFVRSKGKIGLVTYVDSRVGKGESYAAAGFKLVSNNTGSRLFWTDYVKRYNRFAVRANKAEGITQKQASEDAGVVPIWGPGNRLFKLDI
jgi:hypothetical protein